MREHLIIYLSPPSISFFLRSKDEFKPDHLKDNLTKKVSNRVRWLCLHVQFSPGSLDGAHAASKGALTPREALGSVLWCFLSCPYSSALFKPFFIVPHLAIISNLLQVCLLAPEFSMECSDKQTNTHPKKVSVLALLVSLLYGSLHFALICRTEKLFSWVQLYGCVWQRSSRACSVSYPWPRYNLWAGLQGWGERSFCFSHSEGADCSQLWQPNGIDSCVLARRGTGERENPQMKLHWHNLCAEGSLL